MTPLDNWLARATRHLAEDSAAQVRSEIQEHHESARQAALADGLNADEADKLALNALGDAKTANCQYRRVLLTSAEARILREGSWESHAICSRPWLKVLLRIAPVAIVAVAIALFFTGHAGIGRDLMIVGIGTSPLFAATLLPIYTQWRSRAYRCVKWIAITGTLVLVFGPETLQWSWLLISCLWPLAWTESIRTSIRRKLPVAQWPRHLYF